MPHSRSKLSGPNQNDLKIFVNLVCIANFSFLGSVEVRYPSYTPDGWSHVHNHATLWLHLASWNLLDFQLSWKSKMEPSVAKRHDNIKILKHSSYLLEVHNIFLQLSIIIFQTKVITMCSFMKKQTLFSLLMICRFQHIKILLQK